MTDRGVSRTPDIPEYRRYPGGLYGQRVIIRIERTMHGVLETVYDGLSTDINMTEYRRLSGREPITYTNHARANEGDKIQILIRNGHTPATMFKLEGSRIALRCNLLSRLRVDAQASGSVWVDSRTSYVYERLNLVLTQSDMLGREAPYSHDVLVAVWENTVPTGYILDFGADNPEHYIEGRLMSQAPFELPPGDDGNWPMEKPKPKAPPEKLPLRKLLIKARDGESSG